VRTLSRVIVGVVGLVALGVGCDSGSDNGSKGFERPPFEEIPAPGGRERPPPEDVPIPTPEALEACRELSAEEDAVERCLQVVRGYPDPLASGP
jgi:hypothetical protein